MFAEEVDLEPLSVSLTEALPEGMAVTGAVPLEERAPALQEAVTAVVWRVEPVTADGAPIDASQLGAHVERALELAGASDVDGGARAVKSRRTCCRSFGVANSGTRIR